MVKNISGGSHSKKMASKNLKHQNNKNLRTIKDDCELYAIITEKLGGGHLRALGIDGNPYMVHMGGKFRNERINRYDFILIGIRDWQTENKTKIMTDLLEIYTETEKNKLMKINNINWSVLNNVNQNVLKDKMDNEHINDIVFTNEVELNYKDLMDKSNESEIKNRISIMNTDIDVEIDIDTI
jgi:initiation factor 1A